MATILKRKHKDTKPTKDKPKRQKRTRIPVETITDYKHVGESGKSVYDPQFLTENEAVNLYDEVEKELDFYPRDALEVQMMMGQKQVGFRRDKTFCGDVLSDGTVPLFRYGSLKYPKIVPMPKLVDQARQRIYKQYGQWCNHVVINRYNNNTDNIGPHQDKTRDMEIGSSVFTVTPGKCARTLQLTSYDHKTDPGKKRSILKQNLVLEPRSIFKLDYDTNALQKHAIITEKTACKPRMSLTYRTIKTGIKPNGQICSVAGSVASSVAPLHRTD
jgi:hypothetical protein